MLQVFIIHVNFSRLFLSVILHDLFASREISFSSLGRIKIRSTGSFCFLAIYNIWNTADLLVWTRKYRIFWLYQL